jgi:hypothetical protein
MAPFCENIRNLLLPPLAIAWSLSIVSFIRRRLEDVARKGGESLRGMDDRAVQLYVRGTALVFLATLVAVSVWR